MLATRYISEGGLYRLVMRSKAAMADAFQGWVEEVVLPTIRKSGRYELQATQQNPLAEWQQRRVDGLAMNQLACATLKQLVEELASSDVDARRLYQMLNNCVNQVVLQTNQSTRKFKEDHGLPQGMSIADFLDPWGQALRLSVEQAYCKFMSDNMEALQDMQPHEIARAFEGVRDKLGHSAIVFGDTCGAMLSVDEARLRKRQLARARSRNQQLHASAHLLKLKPAGAPAHRSA